MKIQKIYKQKMFRIFQRNSDRSFFVDEVSISPAMAGRIKHIFKIRADAEKVCDRFNGYEDESTDTNFPPRMR